MRIALGQLESGTDIQANLAVIDRFAAEAALDGTTLVAFVEYTTYEKKKVRGCAAVPHPPALWSVRSNPV